MDDEILSQDEEPKMFKCINKECKAELSTKDIDNIQGIKCPFCGGRVLVKLRSKGSKRASCE